MNRKLALALTLTLLAGMLNVASNVQRAKASGTIYIRADGSVDPPDVPISTVDNVTYTFTDNINDSIVVERDNIIVDGAGYTVSGGGNGNGIAVTDRTNVTIGNMTIENFGYGILLSSSSNNTLLHNNVTANNEDGINLSDSSGCLLSANDVTDNGCGIELYSSSSNVLSGNNVAENRRGTGYNIRLDSSSNNTLSGNNVADCYIGIWLYGSSNCVFSSNVMEGNGEDFRVEGNALSHYLHSIDASNLVNGKPVCYFVNQSGMVVNADAYPEVGYLGFVNCVNVTVQGLSLTNIGRQGLFLAFTSGSRIISNDIAKTDFGISLVYSSNNTLFGNNVTANNVCGISLDSCSSNTIYGNNIADNTGYGVELDSSSNNNSISENNITNNSYDGVNVASSSNNNVISGNRIASNEGGIQISSSDENLVFGNNITNNGYRWGICLTDSSNSTISGNVMNGNKHNFYVSGSKLGDFVHSIDVSNIVDDKPVYYLASRTDIVISPPTYPQVGWLALIDCSNVDVRGLTFTNNGQGLLLAYTSNSRIEDNDIANNEYGIYLDGSSNCSISGNNITNNDYGILHRCTSNSSICENNIEAKEEGIWLWNTSSTIVSGNNVANSRWVGVDIDHSSDNTISRNNVANNGYGINLYVSSSNIVNGNNMKTNYCGIVLAYSLNNSILGNNLVGNSCGFQLDSSNYNIISGNNVTANNSAGILLRGSAYNKISGNDITNNGEGIILQKSVYDGDSSNHNIISENTITSNLAGIALSYSSDNVVYHNNFINNTSQVYSVGSVNVWDDGYPSGGNYWSDYAGVDLCSSPNQTVTGSDGVGDTPYVIDEDNVDNYPLMAPYSRFEAGTWNETPYDVDFVSNSTVSDFHFNPEEGSFLEFNVTGEEGTAGFCRVAIPKSLLWAEDGQWIVLVGTVPITNYTTASDQNYTYLYFTYGHTTETVQITGTKVVPEFPSATFLEVLIALTTFVAVLVKKRRFKRLY